MPRPRKTGSRASAANSRTPTGFHNLIGRDVRLWVPMTGPDRTVLVTGAGTGIGLATLIELARRGFSPVGGVRTPSKARSVISAARAAHVKVRTVTLDVTDARQCKAVIDELKPSGLASNAGVPASGAIEDVTDEVARLAMETMVLGPIRLARLAIPHMRERHTGRIVNISSVYGLMTTPLTGWYQAAKHALEALSDALRIEVASAGIKVILVEPGGFRTGIWDDSERTLAQRQGSRFASAYRRSLRGIKLTEPLMGDPST